MEKHGSRSSPWRWLRSYVHYMGAAGLRPSYWSTVLSTLRRRLFGRQTDPPPEPYQARHVRSRLYEVPG